jgi:heat shock protein HslJ/uncharacterized membrane protein
MYNLYTTKEVVMMKSFGVFLWAVFFLTSCMTNKKALQKLNKPSPAPILSESLQQKQLNGVDFFARGNIPASWTLEIDFGNIIRFKSLDGTDVNSSAVLPVEIPENKASSYTTNATNGTLNIMVYEEACTDGWSGEKYNKKVVVTVNSKRYEGCGQYLFDASLNGKWILQKINNRTLDAADFAKGFPEIDVQLTKGRLSGHDGCNSINGSFEVLGSKIKFNQLASTQMACLGNKKENEFSQYLSAQTVDYYFKDSQLYFYLTDDSILVFKKG